MSREQTQRTPLAAAMLQACGMVRAAPIVLSCPRFYPSGLAVVEVMGMALLTGDFSMPVLAAFNLFAGLCAASALGRAF